MFKKIIENGIVNNINVSECEFYGKYRICKCYTNAEINNSPVIIFKIFSPPCGIRVNTPRNPDFKKSKPYFITRLFSDEITYTG